MQSLPKLGTKLVKGAVFNSSPGSPLGQITSTGFSFNNPRLVGPMRTLGRFAIVYILDGAGRYQDLNGFDQKIGPGDFIILFPDLGHTYGPIPGKTWSSIWICFVGPLFNLWQAKSVLDVHKPIHHLQPVAHWHRQMISFSENLEQRSTLSQLGEIVRLQSLLLQIVRSSYQNELKDPDWILKACEQLESKLDRNLNWKDVAKSLGMGDENFRKKFTRLRGVPPSHYRINRKIDKACELVIEGKLNNKQIAEKLGFCDEFYFSRCFRTVIGKSPRSFRENYD